MAEPAKPYHHGNLAQALVERAAEVIDEQGIEALSLRGLARDLDVSHGAPNRHFRNKAALLSALATEGWQQLCEATLSAADATGSANAHVRLNAMGRGYLRWALNHHAMFRAIYHPEVSRQANSELKSAIARFADVVRSAIEATQAEGRHSDVPLPVLTLYTNAVPTGAALLLMDQLVQGHLNTDMDQERLIAQVIDLVVPLPAEA